MLVITSHLPIATYHLLITEMKYRLLNILSDAALILGAYFFYTETPHFREYFSQEYFLYVHFSTLDVFFWTAVLMIIVLIPVRFLARPESLGRSLVVFRTVRRLLLEIGRNDLSIKVSKTEKIALLATLVKFFYIPLMLSWSTNHLTSLLQNISVVLLQKADFYQNFKFFFDDYLFWSYMNLIIFIDVFIFCVGYMVESRFLKNTIRSVEPTLFGWMVTLICYPPFNTVVGFVFPWQSKDHLDFFGNFWTNFTLNMLIIVAMTIYVWASVALGLKASNLTNRGIVSSGPYRYIRHPAYIAKNFTWWIGAFPALFIAWNNQGYSQALFVIVVSAVWSLIYFFRAITEERHLSRDPDYRAYCSKVKWRFIPGIM